METGINTRQNATTTIPKVAGKVIEEMRDCGSFAHEMMMARSQTKPTPNQEAHE